MKITFIATISNHRVLGNVILPYVAVMEKDKVFFMVKDRLTTAGLKEYEGKLPEGMEELVKYSEQYDENEIVRVFAKKNPKKPKKLSSSDFYNKLEKDDLDSKIRPYVELRLQKCVDLIREYKIPLYFKDQAHNIHYEDNIKLVETPSEAIFHFIREEDGLKYFLSIKNKEKHIELTDKSGFVLVNSPGRLILDNKLYFFNDIDGKKLLPFFTKKHIQIPKASEKKYFETFIKNSIRNYTVIPKGFEINLIAKAPKPSLAFENSLEGNPIFALNFEYDFNSVFMANKPTEPKVLFKIENDQYIFHKILRDYDSEKLYYDFLKDLGLKNGRGPNFTINKEGYNQYDLITWLSDNKSKILNKGVKINQSFFNDRYVFDEIKLDFTVKKDNDWFDVHAIVHIGNVKIPFIHLRRNILKNIREFELPNGKITILPEEWFEKYRDLFLFGEKREKSIKIKNIHANIFTDKIELPDNNVIDNVRKLELKDGEDGFAVPEGLNATLRPYQLQGFNYMLQTTKNRLGVCLADDMGLGKTLQTLSVLQYRFGQKENVITKVLSDNKIAQMTLFSDNEATTIKEKRATLIVMPSSLIHNWHNEIVKFTPSMKVCIYTGFNRVKDISKFGEYDIILTTYGTLRVDSKILEAYQFFYIILDESQVIKNFQSKTYKAVNSLNSIYKLVLTGTPIENSLSDLWSQLNFVNNGLLGSYSFFKKEFLTPIEKFHDEQKQEKLKQLIKPFILRRTKHEVAKDLPAINEQTIFCNLTEEQDKIYETEKSKIRNHILQNIDENGIEKSAFVVLQGITRLRQLANHPLLADDEYNHDSGKYEEVIRNIDNLAIENHKGLIFSSFVKHLDLFENYLKEKGYKYSKLTGQTKNREEEVKNFQEDPEKKFFLISLKAGGVGLNLTAAEYVFILDPWWNPAAESQAVNRAHRIGQENKVFVYRFISKSTIEEKIQGLQNRKSQLAEIFVNSNNPFKQLSVENVMELFD